MPVFLLGFIAGFVGGIAWCVLGFLFDEKMRSRNIAVVNIVEKITRPRTSVTLQEDLETPDETLDRLIDETD